MTDDSKYLHRLIEQGEHAEQDFKYKVADACKLARSVSAFANTRGGRLLIGVRDDGHVSGVRSEEEIYMMHAAATRYCRPAAQVDFETLHADGRTVVVATVAKADRRPIRAADEDGRWKAYLRMADENILASPVHIELWRQEQQPALITHIGQDEKALLHALETNPSMPLNQIVRTARLTRRRAIGLLARLIRYDLVLCRLDGHQFVFSAQ